MHPIVIARLQLGKGRGFRDVGPIESVMWGQGKSNRKLPKAGGGSIVSESVWSDISYSFIFIFVSIMKKNKKMITSLGTTITKPNLPPEA